MHKIVFAAIYILNVCQYLCVENFPEGHLKPLGSHVEPSSVDEVYADSMISPKDFVEKYVLPRKPLVLRNVAKLWPAFSKWSEEYLKETYPDVELRLEKKKEKVGGVPAGDVSLGRDTMKNFVSTYRNPNVNKYVVSELPTPMWKEVFAPPPLTCGPLLKSFVEIDLWMNSDNSVKGAGGSSLLHKDAYNTINCVLKGTKEWKLIELQYNDLVYQSWEAEHDRGWGGFSLIDPKKVDMLKYPRVGKIPHWQFTTINAGDCLHLPSQMWHQVNSYGVQNMAVAFLFDMFEDQKELDMAACTKSTPDLPLSEIDVALQYPGHGMMQMGHPMIEEVHEELQGVINSKKGHMTLKSVYRTLRQRHFDDDNMEEVKRKAKATYGMLLKYMDCEDNIKKCTEERFSNLTRAQIRSLYEFALPTEPANTYEFEYYQIAPDDVADLLTLLAENNGGSVKKQDFIDSYVLKLEGTTKFAEDFWKKLAGDKDLIDKYDDNDLKLFAALEKYHYYTVGGYEDDEEDDKRLITPQGHKTEPKREIGGYDYADDQGKSTNRQEQARDEL